MFGDNRKVNVIMRCPLCGKVYPANETICKRCCNQRLISESEYKNRGGQPSLKSYQTKSNSANKNVPKCPTCGSTNIEKISSFDKAARAVMFGLFSKTARSQFKCTNCGYKW